MRKRSLPLFASLLLLALLPWTLAAFPSSGSQTTAQDPFRQQMVWNFAMLQYVNAQGELTEVRATDLRSMHLLLAEDTGLMRLELVYENNDYSSVELSDFHLIRRSSASGSADVSVIRSRVQGMSFPAFAGK